MDPRASFLVYIRLVFSPLRQLISPTRGLECKTLSHGEAYSVPFGGKQPKMAFLPLISKESWRKWKFFILVFIRGTILRSRTFHTHSYVPRQSLSFQMTMLWRVKEAWRLQSALRVCDLFKATISQVMTALRLSSLGKCWRTSRGQS